MPNGAEIAFAGGRFDSAMITDTEIREGVEKELNKVANVPASHIFTMDKPIIERSEAATAQDVLANATQHFDQENKIPAGTPTLSMAIAQDAKPVLNPDGVAGPLEQAKTTEVPINLADKLAAAKAAIAASGSAHTPRKTP